MLQKQKITGGGKLTKAEERIVQSQAYTDLALKLGNSATGNDARSDSDAVEGAVPTAPTQRLRNAIECTDDEDVVMANEFDFDGELRKYIQRVGIKF